MTKVRFEFNELIKDINNAVFAATNEILINKNCNRIEKENFKIFDRFYNSKNV